MNGLMIDMARLIERKSYYFKIIDFMNEWGMDTLQFHFSDDQGFAIRLEGFENIASENAFSVAEIREFIEYAATKGIEVIPELEVFGHTRFLTENPAYSCLGLGKQDDSDAFSAVDPLSKKTYEVIGALVKEIASIFKSDFFHIGCDEVSLQYYCREKDLDPELTWVDYVNKIIGMVLAEAKRPVMWADHPAKKRIIAERLRKDVTLAYWCYLDEVKKEEFARLVDNGHENIILCPALTWCHARFFPPQSAFNNLGSMLELKKKYKTGGIINTAWCPYRYWQDTLYYGIARSAEMVKLEDDFDIESFNRKFASLFFHEENNETLIEFLKLWPFAEITGWLVKKFESREYKMDKEEKTHVEKVNNISSKLMELAENIEVKYNQNEFEVFVLSAKSAWLCTEALLLKNSLKNETEQYSNVLREVRQKFKEHWKKGRYPEDMEKRYHRSKRFQYAFFTLRDLPEKF
jgi:hypothetical protein